VLATSISEFDPLRTSRTSGDLPGASIDSSQR
jgi:hypothetical protein